MHKERERRLWEDTERMKPKSEASVETKQLTRCSWTFSLQNCEKITACCLSHPVSGALLS